jgi:hypothetical protein
MSNEGRGLSWGFVGQVDGVVGHLLLVEGAQGIMTEGGMGLFIFKGLPECLAFSVLTLILLL